MDTTFSLDHSRSTDQPYSRATDQSAVQSADQDGDFFEQVDTTIRKVMKIFKTSWPSWYSSFVIKIK